MGTVHDLDHQRRIDLSETVMALLEQWGVTPEDQIRLLGLPPGLRPRKLVQYRSGTPLPEEDEISVRIHYLLSIHKALATLFPHNPQAADYWLTTPNRYFERTPPLEVMLQRDLEGMRLVLDHLTGTGEWGSVTS
jgi:hypothetical protein